jgi:hypothetical protein
VTLGRYFERIVVRVFGGKIGLCCVVEFLEIFGDASGGDLSVMATNPWPQFVQVPEIESSSLRIRTLELSSRNTCGSSLSPVSRPG